MANHIEGHGQSFFRDLWELPSVRYAWPVLTVLGLSLFVKDYAATPDKTTRTLTLVTQEISSSDPFPQRVVPREPQTEIEKEQLAKLRFQEILLWMKDKPALATYADVMWEKLSEFAKNDGPDFRWTDGGVSGDDYFSVVTDRTGGINGVFLGISQRKLIGEDFSLRGAAFSLVRAGILKSSAERDIRRFEKDDNRRLQLERAASRAALDIFGQTGPK